MSIWKVIFSVLTVAAGASTLMNWVPDETGMPIMFVFLGLSLLTSAKEYYDKGAKKDAVLLAGAAIFLYAITAYNFIGRFF